MTRVFDEQSAIAPLITPDGLRVVGGIRRPSGTWQPAMVDPATGQCVWQGAGEFTAAFGVWTPRFATRGDVVFVFNEGWLGCFDGKSGAQKWKVALGSDLSHSSRRWHQDGATDDFAIDLLETGDGLAAVVRTDDHRVFVFDLATGGLLWSAEPYSGGYHVLPQVGVLLHFEDAPSELRGLRGDVKWGHEMESATVSGRHIFAKVRGEDGDALVCLDAVTGAERWRVEEDSVDGLDDAATGLDQALLTINGSFSQRAWSVSADAAPPKSGFLARLFGRTHGAPLPVKRAVFNSATRVGSRVFVVADSAAGKHMITLDASSGRSVAAPVALGHVNWVLVRGQGEIAVARCEQEESVALQAFGANGARLWTRELDEANEHFCSGPNVIVELTRQVAVLDAADGTTRFAYAN